MKKLFAVSILAVLAITVYACGGSGGGGTTGPSSTFQGTFAFQEAVVTEGGTTITLRPPDMTGAFVFNPDGRFTLVLGGRNIATESYAGNFSLTGSTVRLNYDDGDLEEWILSPDQNQLSGTYTEGGMTVNALFVRA